MGSLSHYTLWWAGRRPPPLKWEGPDWKQDPPPGGKRNREGVSWSVRLLLEGLLCFTYFQGIFSQLCVQMWDRSNMCTLYDSHKVANIKADTDWWQCICVPSFSSVWFSSFLDAVCRGNTPLIASVQSFCKAKSWNHLRKESMRARSNNVKISLFCWKY